MDKIKTFFKIIGSFLLAGICGIFYLFAKREINRPGKNDNRRNINGIGTELDSQRKQVEREREQIKSERTDIDREREGIKRDREGVNSKFKG